MSFFHKRRADYPYAALEKGDYKVVNQIIEAPGLEKVNRKPIWVSFSSHDTGCNMLGKKPPIYLPE